MQPRTVRGARRREERPLRRVDGGFHAIRKLESAGRVAQLRERVRMVFEFVDLPLVAEGAPPSAGGGGGVEIAQQQRASG